MSLQKTIEEKLNIALKNKDKNVFQTLRLVMSAIKDAEINNRSKGTKALTDSDLLAILKKMIKQRNDSCEAYKKANREDLLNQETNEIKIISQFLPKQLNDNETEKICKDVITELKATSIKDMGKIMGVLKSKHSDSLDFSKVSSIIKGLLS